MGVYYMSEDKLYQKAVTLIKSRNYEGAKAILEELDSLEAKRLLNRVNSALSKQKQDMLAQRVNAPEKAKNVDLSTEIVKGIKQAKTEERQTKAKQQGIGCLVLLAICGVCSLIYVATSQPSLKMSEAKMCVDALRGMPMGTQCVLELFPEAMEFCYSRLGDVYDTNINQWYDCLDSQDVNTNMLDFPD
jgi:hypothetical protein